MSQIPLRFDGMSLVDGATDKLVELFAEGVHRIGLKRCAYDLGVDESRLSNALAGRDRHPRKLDWLPYVAIHDPSLAIADFIASLRGHDIVPQKPASPEEELLALREAMDECLGADMRQVLIARARRKTVRR